MKHYSNKEKTGISKKEEKIIKLCYGIKEWIKIQKNRFPDKDNFKITRHELRQIIVGSLNIFNKDAVSLWINWLINQQLIIQNPTSHLINVKDGCKFRKKIMPTLDTKYYIDDSYINIVFNDVVAKIKVNKHNYVLDNFGEKLCTHTPNQRQIDTINSDAYDILDYVP